MRNRAILRALATYSILGAMGAAAPAQFIAAQEPKAVAADAEIASLLTNIENGLKDSQAASSAKLLEMLVSAKGLLPSASPEGARLMRDFPDRLMKVANHERDTGELAKSINLQVFADSAVSFVTEQKPVATAQPIAKVVPAEPAPTKVVPPEALPARTDPQVAMVQPVMPPMPAKPTPVAPKPSVTAPVAPQRPLSAMEQTVLQRGDTMMSLGDISAARLLYQYAANAGVGIAAYKLANTYDSDFLAEHNLRGVRSDREQATIWYRKAQEMGEPRAQERLKVMLSGGRTP